MFEHRRHPLLSTPKFILRMLRQLGFACLGLGVALGLGVLGYHHICGLGWVDSVYNASLILSGMGPASDLRTDAGKLFASGYSLFSGIVFIGAAGVLIAPVIHRIAHSVHVSLDAGRDPQD